ncbi:hypothetical protein BKA70DRAFT_1157706 [Coprinopsis sp. MPI-PUGE-AT-0042]|nr:hypothetical protein BKA70DRAFT_1157706 [Coprinopsis sp. MPI-PUGE-AT-0042]
MSSETPYESVEEARKRLDDRLLALEKEIIDTKHQRNQLAPISRLPVEVMSKIFLDCSRNPWSSPQTTYSPFASLHGPAGTRWTGISHVCHQWREVALGCSELWSLINPNMSAKWIEAMIERSQDTPISIVDFNISYIYNSKKRELLLKVLSDPGRWRSVELRVTDGGDDVSKLICRLTSPAPYLVDLSLNLEGSTFSRSRSALRRDFLGGNVPSLRRLAITHCHPSWNPDLFSNSLTSLKLSNPPVFKLAAGGPFLGPSAQELADILGRIPLLTELDLQMQLPDMTTLEPTGRSFEFLHLRKLCLVGECGELAGLLASLRIPSTARMEISCAKASEATLLLLGCAVEKAWTTHPAIDGLSLWQPPSSVGGRIQGFHASSPGVIPLIISMDIISHWEWSGLPKAYSLLGVVSWDDVETLDAECSVGLGEKSMEWIIVFERMKRVKTLNLSGEAAREFTKALTHHTKQPGSHSGSTSFTDTVPLPYLDTLIITGANVLLTNKNTSTYGPNTQASIVTLRDIIQWMQRRQVLGAPKLKQVAFKDCYGFSPKVQELFQKLQKLDGAENLSQERCMAEVEDLDAESDSEEEDEDEDDYYDGYGYNGNPYLSDDGVCNACLEPGCEGECEDF